LTSSAGGLGAGAGASTAASFFLQENKTQVEAAISRTVARWAKDGDLIGFP
jgi:hypothetical protein